MYYFQLDAWPLGPIRSVQLLLGLAAFGIIGLVLFKFLITQKNHEWKLSTGHHSEEVGLDAAEKGSRRLLAEKVPYNLEKRAIMHKRWLMVGHDSQFKKPGDYRTYTIADIPFLLIRGKDNQLRAFHNVCRHRAYTVARKQAGNSLRLSCKYHGWQYESTGRLLKAPQFMDKADFEVSANGLFEIHLRKDSGGFVFLNFATDLSDAFPWSDISARSLKSLNFAVANEWEIPIDINWRTASKFSLEPHVLLLTLVGLLPWFINPANFSELSWQQRFLAYMRNAGPRLQYVDDASFICNIGHGSFLLLSALPVDGSKTLLRVTHIPAPERPVSRLRKLLDSEIKSAISSLKQHRTTNTNLDFRQSAIRERLDKFSRHIDHQRRMEKMTGRKINPATRVTGHSSIDTEAEYICQALEGLEAAMKSGCVARGGTELEW